MSHDAELFLACFASQSHQLSADFDPISIRFRFYCRHQNKDLRHKIQRFDVYSARRSHPGDWYNVNDGVNQSHKI